MSTLTPTSEPAIKAMQNANQIIEDFTINKYAIYTVLYLVEIALCFYVLSKM